MPVFIALASGILFSLLPGGIYIGIVLWVLSLALLLLKKPVYSALTVGVALGWSTMFVARPPDISAFSTASHDHRLRLIAIVNDIPETP